MSSRGYTRRDHRHRKRYSKRRKEILLDKLLKIFFYILVVLIAIILVKVIFFGDKKEPSKEGQTTTVSGSSNSSTTPSGEISSDENSSGSDEATKNSEDTSTTDPTTDDTSESQTSESDTTTEDEPDTDEPSTSYIPTGDYALLNDSVFIGDSRVGGLYLSSQLTTTTFYYDVGGNVTSALSTDSIKLDNGGYGTMIDALKQRQFEHVFIQYGVNEWGWNTSSFIAGYEKLINEIKAVQPNAQIYVTAIIPVTADWAEERAGNNAMNVNLKLDEMDAQLKTMAESNGVNYINIVEAITGGERVLSNDMSSDGYHLNRTQNIKMLDYICNAIE